MIFFLNEGAEAPVRLSREKIGKTRLTTPAVTSIEEDAMQRGEHSAKVALRCARTPWTNYDTRAFRTIFASAICNGCSDFRHCAILFSALLCVHDLLSMYVVDELDIKLVKTKLQQVS